MDTITKEIIRDITSSYMKADHAAAVDEPEDELKHLLFAVNDISALLLLHLDGRISDACARGYVASQWDSVKRISDIYDARSE